MIILSFYFPLTWSNYTSMVLLYQIEGCSLIPLQTMSNVQRQIAPLVLRNRYYFAHQKIQLYGFLFDSFSFLSIPSHERYWYWRQYFTRDRQKPWKHNWSTRRHFYGSFHMIQEQWGESKCWKSSYCCNLKGQSIY